MTVSNKVVKITAKTVLKNNMLKSIFCVLPLIFCAVINTYVSFILNTLGIHLVSKILNLLCTLFLTLPIFFGVLRYFWRLSFSAEDSPVSVFYYFSNFQLYKKCLKLVLYLIIKSLPIIILLALPVFAVWLISQGSIFKLIGLSVPLWTANLSYVITFLATLSTIFLIIFMLKFYLSPLLFIADEDIDIAEAIHMSTVISKKSSLDFGFLIISFIGWILLSFLILPLIFTLPYFFSAYCAHCRFAITEYNNHIKTSFSDTPPTFNAEF